jgi:hypothetical protein
MAETLKYDRTSDGVHIWRYTDGSIFCAASGSDRTATTCYPLAQQYVSQQPVSPVLASADTAMMDAPIDPFWGLLLGFISLIVVGVGATYQLAPPKKSVTTAAGNAEGEIEDEDTQAWSAPLYFRPPVLPTQLPSGDANDDDDDDTGEANDGSQSVRTVRTRSESVRKAFGSSSDSGTANTVRSMTLSQFKKFHPPGDVDARTLALEATRNAALAKMFDIYTSHGAISADRVIWLVFGLSKGGNAGDPRRELWAQANNFVKPVMQSLRQYSVLPADVTF